MSASHTHGGRSAPSAPLNHPEYRPDIDGLRAVAVLSVVVFHAFPSLMRGGFVGVDIFFVISGYLISSIIFQSLHTASFSFVEFFSRRIRRIFPPLLPMLVFCYALGWFALDAVEFKQLGKHQAGGSGFVSNLILWKESGYFDNQSDTKPLLHLWSLGIEEQFYILWPLLLWLAWKLRLSLLAPVLALGAVSLGLNMALVHTAPVATFYLPLTRFWELLAGALLAYATLAKPPPPAGEGGGGGGFAKVATLGSAQVLQKIHLQSLLGALLLLAGFILISKDKAFPGGWALVPTLGAVLLIAAGPRAWFNRVVLSHPLLVWFGLISFPLYLWHWPLLTYARILSSGTAAPHIRLLAVLLATALAWLSYRLLEAPIRRNRNPKVVLLLALLLFALGYLGFATYQHHGLPLRPTAQLLALKATGDDGGDQGQSIAGCGLANPSDNIFQNCKHDRRATPRYALLGDSKAGALYAGLVRTSTDAGRWLFIGGTSHTGAPVPVLSDNPLFERHQQHIRIALDAIVKNPHIEVVVLAAGARNLFNINHITELPASPNYPAALQALNLTVDKILHSGKRVFLVVDNPTLPDPQDCIGRVSSSDAVNRLIAIATQTLAPTCQLGLAQHRALTENYTRLLQALERKHPEHLSILDVTNLLCDLDQQHCLPYKNGRLLYGFTDHISDYAAGLIGQQLNAELATHPPPSRQ
ncbi:MAG: acyltransferase [Rhodoferax sp.]|nr:acyltransferase [Rhodoferax sp.]